MVFTVDSRDGVRGAAARAVGTDIVDQVRTLPYVADAASAWTSPPAVAAGLWVTRGRHRMPARTRHSMR
jgi:putative drug exporter of the RND superfamily